MKSTSQTHVRACKCCGLILKEEIWEKSADCPNCKFNNENPKPMSFPEYTTTSFHPEYSIYYVHPDKSKIAAFLSQSECSPGLYVQNIFNPPDSETQKLCRLQNPPIWNCEHN